MKTTNVVCSVDEKNLPPPDSSTVPVVLFSKASADGYGYVGSQLAQALKELPAEPPIGAFDFLSFAHAVVAADTFVARDNQANRWHRDITLTVPVSRPSQWRALESKLSDTLNFLTGDNWRLVFSENHFHPKGPKKFTHFEASSACLFSGGLDSAVGAYQLFKTGEKPILVSQAYRGDRSTQNYLHTQLKLSELPLFQCNVNPKRLNGKDGLRHANDTTMRGRSILFLGMGILTATAISTKSHGETTTLFVPENGFISINPPLTPRRIGTNSTRTTHPYFLSKVQEIISELGLPVTIENPYRGFTKGELLADIANDKLFSRIAKYTHSCGKMQRRNRQCGKCIPCIIRRAAFHRAKLDDDPNYESSPKDALLYPKSRDDVLALLIAVSRYQGNDIEIEKWAKRNGPLPTDPIEREKRLRAVKLGLTEIENYLKAEGCK